MAAVGTSAAGLNPSEQAAMDEIRRRLKEGAEVVCIVRSRRDPQSKSEVIMLDKASPEFLQQLAAETQSQKGRQETSLELPRPKQPSPGMVRQSKFHFQSLATRTVDYQVKAAA